MKRWQGALMGVAWSVAALAGHAQSVRSTAEGSMLVTGTVQVNPDGSLGGYSIDQPDKLPEAVVNVLAQSLPRWQFKLAAPATQPISARMHIRVVAKPLGEGNYRVAVEGASFEDDGHEGGRLSYRDRSPAPIYPDIAASARVSGTVYLLLRVGRTGAVEDAVAEQVNLEQYATRIEMAKFRKSLASASLDAARRWTFNPPTQGSAVNDPFWIVRVPVQFNLRVAGVPNKPRAYGSWQSYIPGPRESAPWASKALQAEAPDALPDGALHSGGAGLVLATPLGADDQATE